MHFGFKRCGTRTRTDQTDRYHVSQKPKLSSINKYLQQERRVQIEKDLKKQTTQENYMLVWRDRHSYVPGKYNAKEECVGPDKKNNIKSPAVLSR